MSFHIRVNARGIVIDKGRILLNEFNGGECYNIPGGGVDPGETVIQAVKREVLEETGLDVSVGDFMYALECEPYKCNFIYGNTSHIGFVFRCYLNGDDQIKPPTIPDKNPDGSDMICEAKWINISDLKNIDLAPKIQDQLIEYIETGIFSPAFLEEPLFNK